MTITLNQLSDFKYSKVNGIYFLEFGSASEDINITNIWHKMSGTISGSTAILTIEAVNPPPSESNFRYRIESPFGSVNSENQPRFSLKIQPNHLGIPTLYAFIGTDDHDISRASAESMIAISSLNNIYFTVENNTFKFYYHPIS